MAPSEAVAVAADPPLGVQRERLYQLGVSPDYRVHIPADVLREHDGRMLKWGLQEIDGERINVPASDAQKPDREFLAERFGRFRAA